MRYRFGPCEIFPERRELVVDGEPRAVEPQVFDLICLFARNPGRLITHDELIEEIWGGRIVSDSAISARISAARNALGDDGARQRYIKTIPRRGFRFHDDVETGTDPAGKTSAPAPGNHLQQVQFCRSSDATRIAYALTGSGYPLVKAGHWLTHLDYDWHSPIWRPFLDRLGQRFQVVRYDQRGNGLSDWDIDDLSLDRFVDDLKAVVDAAELDRFALYGTSQGAPIAIAFACRFPDCVSHLVLHGGYQSGRLVRASESERASGDAILTLIRNGWGKEESPFLKMFASMYLPEGTQEAIDTLTELQRRTTSAENAARIREAVDRFDVRSILAQVDVPTLVLHARNDGVHPLDQGRKLAAGIPGSAFVLLESSNHVILEHEPAWDTLFDAIADFIRIA